MLLSDGTLSGIPNAQGVIDHRHLTGLAAMHAADNNARLRVQWGQQHAPADANRTTEAGLLLLHQEQQRLQGSTTAPQYQVGFPIDAAAINPPPLDAAAITAATLQATQQRQGSQYMPQRNDQETARAEANRNITSVAADAGAAAPPAAAPAAAAPAAAAPAAAAPAAAAAAGGASTGATPLPPADDQSPAEYLAQNRAKYAAAAPSTDAAMGE